MITLNASNNAYTTLANAITETDTTIIVNSSAGFPDTPFRVTLSNASNIEIVEITAVDGNTWTVIREVEGTTAQSWEAGTSIELRWTAGLYEIMRDGINTLETDKANKDMSNVTAPDPIEPTDVSNKRYVDAATAAIGLVFYPTKDPDTEFPEYFILDKYPSASPETIEVSASTAGDILIGGWLNLLSFDRLKFGAYVGFVTAEVISGNIDVQLKFMLYEKLSDGTEILIGESNLSPVINSKDIYSITFILSEDYIFNDGRLLGKLYAVYSTGGASTTIRTYFGGPEASRLIAPNDFGILDKNYSFIDLSNVEDSVVIDKVKNVDGADSGLDADMLDGKHADELQAAGPNILDTDPTMKFISLFGSLSGTAKWFGGILASNGKIYGIPLNSTQVLESALAPNGKIYAMPYNSTQVLEIDPETQNVTLFGSLSSDNGKWAGGVLAPNGKIYGIPFSSTQILEIDPETQNTTLFGNFSGAGKWFGGVLAPNGVLSLQTVKSMRCHTTAHKC